MKKFFLTAALLPMALMAADVCGVYSPRNVKVDGKLNEAVWKTAPVIKSFVRPDGVALERKTTVQIVFTPQQVVFGFKVYIPQNELIIKKTLRDKSTTSIDCVEVMIDTAAGGDNYKHIIVNAGNGIFDRYCEQGGFVGDEKWNAEFSSAVTVNNDHWVCELAIPYRSLDLQANDGKRWKVNIARESFGSPTSPREVSSICNGEFNNASAFIPLAVPAKVNLEQYKLDVPTLTAKGSIANGRMNLKVDVSISNLAVMERELNAELLIPQPSGTPARAADRFKLAAKGNAQLSFGKVVLDKPGIYTAIFTLRDQATNRILLRKEYPVNAVYTPLAIKVIDPHYRNSVFATQKLKEVRFAVQFDLPDDQKNFAVTGGIRQNGKVIMSNKITLDDTVKGAKRTRQVTFTFPVDKLPFGKMEIFAAVGRDETTAVLRKLPYKKGEVWRGKDGNWYRDGKKLFIMAGWNYADDYNEHYNIVSRNPEENEEYLFYNVNTFLGIGRIKKDLVAAKLTDNVKAFYQQKIDMYKDHPRLFGHFLCDEPDIAGYSQEGFRLIYEYLIDLDPYHPFMICPGTSGTIDFADAAEISGFHCYPKVEIHREMANFDKIVHNMDRSMAHFRKTGFNPTITYVHQGFDYSDSDNTDTRIPTYEEFRNQNLLSLILGGKGLMHYNRGVDNFPELYIGMKHLTHEQKVIGNEAIIEDDAQAPVTVLAGNLRVLAKRNAATGEYWVLVCNTSYNTGVCSFSFAPFGNNAVQVLSEKRSVKAVNGVIKDHFKPYDVHVYTTSKRDFGLKSIADINQSIKDVYIARRKANAGHLFYQERENGTVAITASSNRHVVFRAENSLWHLTDGLVGDPAKPAERPTGRGIIVWEDNTPNRVPDSVTIKSFKPVTIGRVEVYPAQDSLKDYFVELMIDGKFVKVAEVKDAKGAVQTLTFAPRRADGLRLTVTANRGKYTKVYEIKAFEK